MTTTPMDTTERDALIAACNADLHDNAACSDFWAAQDDAFEGRLIADFERGMAMFEAAYDKHIEEMATGDY